MPHPKDSGLKLDIDALRSAKGKEAQAKAEPFPIRATSDQGGIVTIEIGQDRVTATLVTHTRCAPGYSSSKRYSVLLEIHDATECSPFVQALSNVIKDVSLHAVAYDVAVEALAVTCDFDAPFIAVVDKDVFDKIDSAVLLGSCSTTSLILHTSDRVSHEQVEKWRDDFYDIYNTINDRTDGKAEPGQDRSAPILPSLLLKRRALAEERLSAATGCASSRSQGHILAWLYEETQKSRLRDSPPDIGSKRVRTPSLFVAGLLTGKLCDFTPLEASTTGFRHLDTGQWDTASVEAAEICTDVWTGLATALGTISEEQTITISASVASALNLPAPCRLIISPPACISAYSSCLPKAGDVFMSLGRSDELVVPLTTLPRDLCTDWHIVPNPLHCCGKEYESKTELAAEQAASLMTKPFLARSRLHDSGVARDIIKQGYTKTWKAFAQLVAAVGYGGTNGLDEPLFAIYISQGQSKGIWRYEHGTRVAEFSDLRASARCLLEGQALETRRRLCQLDGCCTGDDCFSFSPDALDLPPRRLLLQGATTTTTFIAGVFSDVIGMSVVADALEAHEFHDITAEANTVSSSYSKMSTASFSAVCFALLELQMQSTDGEQKALPNMRAVVQQLRAGQMKDTVKKTHLNTSRFEGEEMTPRPRPRSAPLTDHAYYLLTSLLLPLSESPTPLSASTVRGSILEQRFASAYAQSKSSLRERESGQIEDMNSRPHHERKEIGRPDADIFTFYGSLLEEYERLHKLIERNIFIARHRPTA